MYLRMYSEVVRETATISIMSQHYRNHVPIKRLAHASTRVDL